MGGASRMCPLYRDYPRDFSPNSRCGVEAGITRSLSHQNRFPFFLVKGFCGGSNFGRPTIRSDQYDSIQNKVRNSHNDLSKISLSQIISISGFKLHSINCSSDRICGPYILHKLPLNHILLPLNDVRCS